jgi:hypothetical protein
MPFVHVYNLDAGQLDTVVKRHLIATKMGSRKLV